MDKCDSSLEAASAEPTAAAMLANWLLKAAPFPVLVVTENARILYVNPLARDVLKGCDGVEMRYGTLKLQREEDQARFGHLLKRTGTADANGEAHVLRIERPSGKRAFALTLLRPEGADPSVPMWIVLISDTSERMSLQPHWIEAMFGVTRGEARVLALVSAGMSAEDIGASLEIATATVRVHLRNVYRKLKINRQSDLVATILKAIMPMCAYEATRDSSKTVLAEPSA